MTNAVSLYLDTLRFAAAFTVFLSHFALGRISGALLASGRSTGGLRSWSSSSFRALSSVGQRDARSETSLTCAEPSIARLYSVIIPAFMLTAALNWPETKSIPGYTGLNGATAWPIP